LRMDSVFIEVGFFYEPRRREGHEGRRKEDRFW